MLRRSLSGFQLSYIFQYGSHPPFNVVTGADRNLDTNVNDRSGASRPANAPHGASTLCVGALKAGRDARAPGVGVCCMLLQTALIGQRILFQDKLESYATHRQRPRPESFVRLPP